VTEEPSGQRTLELEADVDRLTEVRAFVREAVADFGGSQRVAEDLVQAVDEASCNILLHGYGGKAGPLEVEVGRRGDEIAIRLLDRARPFDPTTARVPAPTGEPTRPGGMGAGVHLLRTMTDAVHHAARPDGGNELTLVRAIGERAEEE
jgi:anti-sigma regulatory factor (Ser/Thr protein kinase)